MAVWFMDHTVVSADHTAFEWAKFETFRKGKANLWPRKVGLRIYVETGSFHTTSQ